jgi:hypothetical protein
MACMKGAKEIFIPAFDFYPLKESQNRKKI